MAEWLAALAALGMLIAVVVGAVIKRVGNVEKNLADHKTHVAETYETKANMKDVADRIERQMQTGFDRIYKLLEGKDAA